MERLSASTVARHVSNVARTASRSIPRPGAIHYTPGLSFQRAPRTQLSYTVPDNDERHLRIRRTVSHACHDPRQRSAPGVARYCHNRLQAWPWPDQCAFNTWSTWDMRCSATRCHRFHRPHKWHCGRQRHHRCVHLYLTATFLREREDGICTYTVQGCRSARPPRIRPPSRFQCPRLTRGSRRFAITKQHGNQESTCRATTSDPDGALWAGNVSTILRNQPQPRSWHGGDQMLSSTRSYILPKAISTGAIRFQYTQSRQGRRFFRKSPDTVDGYVKPNQHPPQSAVDDPGQYAGRTPSDESLVPGHDSTWDSPLVPALGPHVTRRNRHAVVKFPTARSNLYAACRFGRPPTLFTYTIYR